MADREHRGANDEFDDAFVRFRRAAVAAGLVLEREIVETLSQPGTGRIYRRRGRTHQASAPGEPPAVDTGRLRNSIKTVDESSGMDIEVRVGTNVGYARPLEFGRRHMAPRPFMRPSLEKARRAMTKTILAVLRDSR